MIKQVMHDGLAGGIVAGPESRRLAGKIPVTRGQNEDLNAMQFIVQGMLDNTSFKDLSVQAAAEVSSSIVEGEGVPKIAVDLGVWTWTGICEGGEHTQLCQENLK